MIGDQWIQWRVRQALSAYEPAILFAHLSSVHLEMLSFCRSACPCTHLEVSNVLMVQYAAGTAMSPSIGSFNVL